MRKRLIIILALAFVLGISFAAYAEVQNVKVGGELSVLSANRTRLNLVNTGGGNIEAIASIAKVKIDAELTEDVSVVARLLNERLWSSSTEASNSGTDIVLDLAYVAMKDFLKDTTNVPLNLIIGRQLLKVGAGLLVGDPDTNQTALGNLPVGLEDLSSRKAFDAVVAVADYKPLTLTGAFIKVTEGGLDNDRDDVNGWILVGAYDLGKDYKDTVAEVIYLNSYQKKNEVANYGIRLTSVPLENLAVEAEYVYQTQDGLKADKPGRHASDNAVRVAANLSLPDVQYTPNIGVDFMRLSENWNVMYEDITPAALMNLILPNTNTSIIGATVSAKPKEDLTLKFRWANARLVKSISSFTSSGTGSSYTLGTNKKYLGNEYDLGLAYDYTSDVKLGLDLGLFKPGKAFASTNRKTASQVVGSMKVVF